MWKWQEAQWGQVGTFSLLESTGVSVRDSASQKFREKLSRSPALGVHARAFVLPRGCPGLGGRHSAVGHHAVQESWDLSLLSALGHHAVQSVTRAGVA